jgi:hypothetical protein
VREEGTGGLRVDALDVEFGAGEAEEVVEGWGDYWDGLGEGVGC